MEELGINCCLFNMLALVKSFQEIVQPRVQYLQKMQDSKTQCILIKK